MLIVSHYVVWCLTKDVVTFENIESLMCQVREHKLKISLDLFANPQGGHMIVTNPWPSGYTPTGAPTMRLVYAYDSCSCMWFSSHHEVEIP